jgi:hypothetical protein
MMYGIPHSFIFDPAQVIARRLLLDASDAMERLMSACVTVFFLPFAVAVVRDIRHLLEPHVCFRIWH